MDKVLFATTNQNKVKRLKNFLGKTPFKIISFNEIEQKLKEPLEFGKDGVEIAKLKAYFYYNLLEKKMPVITQDDTLNFYDIPESLVVKNSIKNPVIDAFGEFNDENAVRYYTGLAKKYGGEFKMSFEYGHGYCDEKVLKASYSAVHGKLVSVPSKKFEPGYFLTAIVKVQVDKEWKYISELTDKEYAQADSDLKRSVSSLLAI